MKLILWTFVIFCIVGFAISELDGDRMVGGGSEERRRVKKDGGESKSWSEYFKDIVSDKGKSLFHKFVSSNYCCEFKKPSVSVSDDDDDANGEGEEVCCPWWYSKLSCMPWADKLIEDGIVEKKGDCNWKL